MQHLALRKVYWALLLLLYANPPQYGQIVPLRHEAHNNPGFGVSNTARGEYFHKPPLGSLCPTSPQNTAQQHHPNLRAQDMHEGWPAPTHSRRSWANKRALHIQQVKNRGASAHFVAVRGVGLVVDLRVVHLPARGWEDVLVAVVPVPVHHLACAQCRRGATYYRTSPRTCQMPSRPGGMRTRGRTRSTCPRLLVRSPSEPGRQSYL